MLSRIKTIILGFIAEKPMSAYDMTKYVQWLELRNWVPVSDSTIYNALRALHQQGYISGKVVREGNMPEKTIYSITQTGKEALHNTIETLSLHWEGDGVTFSIILLFMYQFETDELVELLQKRTQMLRENKEKMERQLAFMQTTGQPYSVLIPHKRNMRLLDLEQDVTEELIWAVQNEEPAQIGLVTRNLQKVYNTL